LRHLLTSLSRRYLLTWPFDDVEDDHLAITTQFSISCTLLGALMSKVNMLDDDDYDETVFAVTMIALNYTGIVLIGATQVIKPLVKFWTARFGEHLTHDGGLRGELPFDDCACSERAMRAQKARAMRARKNSSLVLLRASDASAKEELIGCCVRASSLVAAARKRKSLNAQSRAL
jgi:hypothetical protein